MKQIEIVLASGNAHKRAEFERFFAPLGVRLSDRAAPPGEIEESGATYEENALIKARAWANATGLPSVADDSGIEVEALGWAPGIRSARAAVGSDADRVRWMLDRMRDQREARARVACFVACIVIAFPGEIVPGRRDFFAAEGRCWGTLAPEPKGENGFGYDPIFIPDGYGRTFGELDGAEKSRVSHRAIAMNGVAQMLPVVLEYVAVRRDVAWTDLI